MKVDTMRAIDRLAGVPLCALATLLLRVAALFARAQPGPARRVLMIELSEMGTTILAAPAMKKAREKLGAELYFAIFKKNVGSLELLGTFPPANVFTIRDTSLATLLVDTLKFLVWTRRNGIDTVIDLELFSRFTALLTGFSGAARRVGYYRFHNEGLYRGEMLTHRVSYNPHIHIAHNLIALVNALIVSEPQIPYSKTPVVDDDLKVSLPVPAADGRAAMRERIRTLAGADPAGHRIVLVNPNASELLPHRRWMPARYAELIARILSQYQDSLVLITGAPGRTRGSRGACGAMRSALRVARRPYRSVRIAGALLTRGLDGDERFRAVALCRRERVAYHRVVRAGDAEALSAARSLARDLCRDRMLALRQRVEPPQDRLHRQCLHAGDRRRSGLRSGGRGIGRRRCAPLRCECREGVTFREACARACGPHSLPFGIACLFPPYRRPAGAFTRPSTAGSTRSAIRSAATARSRNSSSSTRCCGRSIG
jgi:ADP-heptose:LPS heptosyltransferase